MLYLISYAVVGLITAGVFEWTQGKIDDDERAIINFICMFWPIFIIMTMLYILSRIPMYIAKGLRWLELRGMKQSGSNFPESKLDIPMPKVRPPKPDNPPKPQGNSGRYYRNETDRRSAKGTGS